MGVLRQKDLALSRHQATRATVQASDGQKGNDDDHAWPRVRVHPTPVRLAVDVVAITLGIITVCSVVWAALWWVGQRR